ncbi:3017_t:CDS:2, partial [Gigaspora margarita]
YNISKKFSYKTHIFEPTALGFDDDKIIHQLLLDIKFIPFYIQHKDISILIANMEVSKNIDLAYAGPNYLAIFTKKIGGTTPIKTWQQMTFLHNYSGLSLFGLKDSKVQQLLQQTLNKKDTQLKNNVTDWDNFKIIEKFFEKHLHCQISTTKINCSKNIEPELTNTESRFWQSFSNSLNKNKKGFDGKRHVLSIIAEDFSSKELYENLKLVSNNLIFAAKQYARTNGPGCFMIEKTVEEITKLVEKDIHKPNLYVSDYSSFKKPWIIPIPQKKEMLLVNSNNKNIEKYNSLYPLLLGWALRSNQKLSKRGKLEDMVKDGKLNVEIPSIKTVEGWIKTYSGKLRQLSTQNLSNSNMKDNTLL